jgi:hypothetical protein
MSLWAPLLTEQSLELEVRQLQSTLLQYRAEIEQLQTQVADQQITIAELLPKVPWPPLSTFRLWSKLPIEIRYRIWTLMMPPPRMIIVDVYDRIHLPLGPGISPYPRRTREEKKYIEYVFRIDRHDGEGSVSALGFRKFAEVRPLGQYIKQLKGNETFVNYPLPAVATVCRESRAVTARFYRVCLSTYLNPACTVLQRITIPGSGHPAVSAVSPIRLVGPGVPIRPFSDVVCFFGPAVLDVLQAARASELNTYHIFRVAVFVDGFKTLLPLFQRQSPHFPNLKEIRIHGDVVISKDKLKLKPVVETYHDIRRVITEFVRKSGTEVVLPVIRVPKSERFQRGSERGAIDVEPLRGDGTKDRVWTAGEIEPVVEC